MGNHHTLKAITLDFAVQGPLADAQPSSGLASIAACRSQGRLDQRSFSCLQVADLSFLQRTITVVGRKGLDHCTGVPQPVRLDRPTTVTGRPAGLWRQEGLDFLDVLPQFQQSAGQNTQIDGAVFSAVKSDRKIAVGGGCSAEPPLGSYMPK